MAGLSDPEAGFGYSSCRAWMCDRRGRIDHGDGEYRTFWAPFSVYNCDTRARWHYLLAVVMYSGNSFWGTQMPCTSSILQVSISSS